jgi:ParB family chromosome partitioning protein
MMQNRGLGRGLSALISEPANSTINQKNHSDNNAAVVELSLDNIKPNNEQPRQSFNQESLHELANSIASRGILQPIIVKKLEDDKYKIVAGERRWRASRIAGKETIPAIIKDIESKELLELAIIENIQREDLTPTEEAESYQRLMNNYNYTQQQLCELLGISRSHIANIVRLNYATELVKKYVNDEKLTLGHAKVLLSATEPDKMAQKAVQEGLTVRTLENLIKTPKSKDESNKYSSTANTNSAAVKEKEVGYDENSEEVVELEESLATNLGFPVRIRTKRNCGEIIIRFENMEQLDDIFYKLSQ